MQTVWNVLKKSSTTPSTSTQVELKVREQKSKKKPGRHSRDYNEDRFTAHGEIISAEEEESENQITTSHDNDRSGSRVINHLQFLLLWSMNQEDLVKLR